MTKEELLKIKEDVKNNQLSKKQELDESVELFCSTVTELSDNQCIINEIGKQEVAKNIKKFGFELMMNSLYMAFNNYYDGTYDGSVKAYKKVTGICYNLKNPIKYGDDIRYIIGICRNRFNYVDTRLLTDYLKDVFETDGELGVNSVKEYATSSKNWSEFKQNLEDLFTLTFKEIKENNKYKYRNSNKYYR